MWVRSNLSHTWVELSCMNMRYVYVCVCVCVYRVWHQLFATLLPRRRFVLLMCRRLTAAAAREEEEEVATAEEKKKKWRKQHLQPAGTLKDISACCYSVVIYSKGIFIGSTRVCTLPLLLPSSLLAPLWTFGIFVEIFWNFCGFLVCLRFEPAAAEERVAEDECKVFV